MMIQLIFSVSSSSTHIIKNHKVNFVVLCLFVCLFLFLLCKFFFLYFFPVPIIFFCCIKSPIPILCNTFAFAFQIMNLQHITTIQSPVWMKNDHVIKFGERKNISLIILKTWKNLLFYSTKCCFCCFHSISLSLDIIHHCNIFLCKTFHTIYL